jgi:uncharacterized protein involved in tellurium resistance
VTRLDPALAPPRTDLPYLRTRTRPRVAPAAPHTIDTSRHTAPARPAPTPSTSLDLSTPPPVRARRPPPPARRQPQRRRAASGSQTLLSPKAPTVTLTRVQSGIGKLLIEAACSAGVGDLRLGCAYQLHGGPVSTVQHEGGNRNGPPDGKHLVLQAQRHEFETIAVDLRHCRDLERLTVYAFSASHVPLPWAGTLVTTTPADASIETPFELARSAPVAVLLSVYQVGGELTLRREMQPFDTTVKAACLAYGYDRITWLDDWTPIS